MNLSEAILYGAVQGVTEYLPVSSSAHLILLPKFLGHQDPGLVFDVFLHIGTLAATLLYFWKDWVSIIKGNKKLFLLIVAGTIPALLAGAAFHHLAETTLRNNLVQAWALSLGGILLWAVDRFQKQEVTFEGLNTKKALWVGVAQCFSIIPGVSRSGSTMTGARLLGMDRAASARFSFLLSAPITAAACIFELRHWHLLLEEQSVGTPALITAGLSSFLFGALAIGGLMKMLRKMGYGAFAIYRVSLALLIVFYLGT